MTLPPLLELAAWLAAGIVLGGVYLRLVARSVAAITAPGPSARAVLWLVLRMVLAVLLLWAAATQGAGPLLAVLLGFLLARSLAIRRTGAPTDGH
ncbi:ATP synthase subunit I [Salipiger mucosus]|uniref:Uncharacterized protein n=1 Tax=Salipiger mucosus DSM 16094 TaxID=1123237 RepID=S9QZC2_9RHOB|nr:ATP synthase subunit I [Salipiger mucosus]EPX84957.1 hypothetical protein Salmuc_00554 [Salipiger mucosus DSM 16094]